MQDKLQLELIDFEMCCSDTDCKLHRSAYGSGLEHGFKHNSDMERIELATDNNRSLQHDIIDK